MRRRQPSTPEEYWEQRDERIQDRRDSQLLDMMQARYIESLIPLCSEEQFGQDAVEWAIISGHVPLTYDKDTDLQYIMAVVDEPANEKPVRRYDQIIEAYRRTVNFQEEVAQQPEAA